MASGKAGALRPRHHACPQREITREPRKTKTPFGAESSLLRLQIALSLPLCEFVQQLESFPQYGMNVIIMGADQLGSTSLVTKFLSPVDKSFTTCHISLEISCPLMVFGMPGLWLSGTTGSGDAGPPCVSWGGVAMAREAGCRARRTVLGRLLLKLWRSW